MFAALIFYMFAGLLLTAGFGVICARNPVHSVLFLVVCFFNAAGLFLLLGAEFLAMVLVVVYVGAVAVLFLFVVMMLDINLTELREGFLQYLPLGMLVGVVLFAEMAVLYMGWHFAPNVEDIVAHTAPPIIQVSNTDALGRLLYTDYAYLFEASGLVLLVAMIGSILLTHRPSVGVRKQVIANQVARNRSSVEVVKVPTGGGI
jgi:NADH-quinone oxidoreductase subunit J